MVEPEGASRRRTGDERQRSHLQRSLERAPRRSVVAGVSAIAVVLLVAFAGLIVGSARAGRESLEERAVQRTVIAEHFIEAYNSDLQAGMRSHAERALAGPAPTADEFTLINEMMRFRAGVLLDEDGVAIQTFPADPAMVGQPLADRYAHLRRAVDGDTGVTGVVPSAVAGEPIVAFAVPYDTPAGRRVFSAGYRVKDTPLGAYLLNATVLAGEALYLVDDSGSIIASSDPTVAVTLAEQDPALAGAAAGGGRGSFSVDGTDWFFSAQPIAGAPWQLVRVLPSEAMYAPASEGRWIPWLIFGAFLVVGLASVVMLNWIIGQRDREHGRAQRDPLTGLANRRSLDAALAERRLDDEATWAVLMIDVDHFKAVNDEHGHRRGDEVLIAVAGAIGGAVRPHDVVGRWGGEEFMVVVDDATLVTAAELGERIRTSVAAQRVAGVAVTVSVGYASSDAAPADGLVDLADAALYRAKQTGRNRSVTLAPEDAFPALRPVGPAASR